VHQSKPARLDQAQRAAARVVRDYVAALNAGDGGRVCRLFVPGALSAVRLPHERGGCAPSLSASIGYRDPRGFPVYRRSRVARIRSVAIDGGSAKAVATIVTRFAGNREPSIEDDIVYLRYGDGRWLIAKPSATLYRAIGTGNIPPSVLAPP
jgi:ketosteroid isomerase-like protein